MYSSPVIHESRNLKQARPEGQYVDLLRKRFTHATPSQQCHFNIIENDCQWLI